MRDEAARIDALGLWGLELSPEIPIDLPTPGAHGFSSETSSWGGIPAAHVAELDLSPVLQPELERSGWSLATSPGAPHAWHLAAPRSQAPAVFLSGPVAPEEDCVAFEEDDPSTAHFDVRAASDFSFLLPDGSGVVVEVKAGRPFLRRAHPTSQPFDVAPAPVQDWLGDEADGWLRDVLDRARASDWTAVLAAGHWVRFRRPSPAQRERLRRTALSGSPDPQWDRARSWMEQLAEADVEKLLERTRREIVSQICLVHAVGEEVAPDEVTWCAAYMKVLHGRDDLESARVLLAYRNRSHDLASLLRRLDREGRALVWSAPEPSEAATDERLQRACEATPGAWWTTPIGPEVEDEG